MTRTKQPAQVIADSFFYFLDGMDVKDIENITGMKYNSIPTAVTRLKKYLQQESSGEEIKPTKLYAEVIKLIQKQITIRERANQLAQIKNTMFNDLGAIIDGVVADIVAEKHAGLEKKIKEQDELIEFLNTQLINQKIIAKSYQKDFSRGQGNHPCPQPRPHVPEFQPIREVSETK